MQVELELPNGIRGANGEWTKKVVIDELTGEDEDILTDRTRTGDGTGDLAVNGSDRITQILSRCTIRIGEEVRPREGSRFDLPDFFAPIWNKAFSSDRNYAMIQLRIATHGPIYRFSGKCECGKETPRVKIDLGTLEVNRMPLDSVQCLPEIKLPKSGDVVTWRYFVADKDDLPISRLLEDQKKDFISALLLRRVVSVNGGAPDGLTYMKRMNAADRRYLGQFMDSHEGGIDTDCVWTCDKCGQEQHHRINVLDPSFFFPTGLGD